MHAYAQQLEYNPADLKPGVVHIGLGGFGKAFVLHYFHDLALMGHKDWGVIGIKPRTEHQPHFDNGYVYSIVTKNGTTETHNIGVLRGVIGGKTAPEAVIDKLAAPETKLVTITIKRAGSGLNESDLPDVNMLSDDVMAIRKDELGKVSTVPGWITASLYKRYRENRDVPTVLSLDNYPRNGMLTERVIRSMAEGIGASFARYATQVTFPNTVVDRIVNEHKGDGPIVVEHHRKLYIEDKFAPGTRPPLEGIYGAQYVHDIHPYEQLKLRLVNGAHLALAVVACSMDIEYVHEAIHPEHNPHIRRYLRNFLTQAAEGLRPRPNVDMEQYIDEIFVRLDNAELPDRINRLLDSTHTKIGPRIFNASALERRAETEAAAFAIASWINYMRGPGDGRSYSLQGKDSKYAFMPAIIDREELVDFLGRPANVSLRKLYEFADNVFQDLANIKQDGMAQTLAQRFPVPDRSRGWSNAYFQQARP